MKCFTESTLIVLNVKRTKVMFRLIRVKRATCNRNRRQLWWSYYWWKEDNLRWWLKIIISIIIFTVKKIKTYR